MDYHEREMPAANLPRAPLDGESWWDMSSLGERGPELFVSLPPGATVVPLIYHDQQALMRVIGMISIADYQDAARVAEAISIRQSASETPAEFVRRISLALLEDMAGLQP